MKSSIFDNASKGLCIICGMPTIEGRITCSERCHEEFIKFGEGKFGTVKKVIDATTGIAYVVPTRDIIERGLAQKDLAKYPLWEEKEEKGKIK